MGGSSGGTQYIAAQAPSVYVPTAPERTAPEAMPENIDQALVTSGAKRTEDENKLKALGATSQLVIPLEGDSTTVQTGGDTSVRTPTGVV